MQYFADAQHLRHHAFVVEGEREEGIKLALGWVERELEMRALANPDVIVREFGLLSVEEARQLGELAMQAPLRGEAKALIICASRMYHEAQNALLKLFEEPPQGTYLFLVLPTAGLLLPTLRSRVQILGGNKEYGIRNKGATEIAEEFMKANKEKRSVMIKKLATGRDEEERRENRDKALAIVNGVETAVYNVGRSTSYIQLLEDIQVLRGYLHDRSAPVRMILEHLSLVLPRDGIRNRE